MQIIFLTYDQPWSAAERIIALIHSTPWLPVDQCVKYVRRGLQSWAQYPWNKAEQQEQKGHQDVPFRGFESDQQDAQWSVWLADPMYIDPRHGNDHMFISSSITSLQYGVYSSICLGQWTHYATHLLPLQTFLTLPLSQLFNHVPPPAYSVPQTPLSLPATVNLDPFRLNPPRRIQPNFIKIPHKVPFFFCHSHRALYYQRSSAVYW